MYNLKLQRIIINDYKILIRKKNFGSVNEGFKNCRSICLQNNLNFNKLKNEDGLGRSNGLFKCKNVNINNKLYQSRTYASSPLPLDDTDFSPPIVRYEGIMKLFVDSPPIEFCQESLVSLHSSTGLPWWATIVLVTCTGRTLVTLPCALYQVIILYINLFILSRLIQILDFVSTRKWDSSYSNFVGMLRNFMFYVGQGSRQLIVFLFFNKVV